MIALLQAFDKIKEALNLKKKSGLIEKFYISINQRNEIAVVVVAEKELLKVDLIEDEESGENVVYTYLPSNELQEDFFYSELFDTNGDCVIDYANSRRKLNNLLNPSAEFKSSIPIVTFYSYKGGMGRSTNLVIASTYLARAHGRKIIIIDCDFEAPGFSNFFLEENSSPIYNNGLIEYFFDKESQQEINLNDYSWEVSKEYSQNGEIRIIPAGNLDPRRGLENLEFPTHLSHYLEGLSRLDLSSTESIINKFKSLIADILEQYSPDAIFIDSRTGFTDIFGVAALQLSSQVVGFFSSSSQNDPGIFQFVQSLSKLANTRTNVYAPILVNSFSDSSYFKEFQKKIEDIIANIGDPQDSFRLSPFYYHFRYDGTLSEIGTTRENKRDWLEAIDDRQFLKGYIDVAEKINESIGQIVVEAKDSKILKEEIVSDIKEKGENDSFKTIQENILENISGNNWPNLYADSENVNYQKEFDERRIFYRDSMMDLFNFTKFIVLGNKGTGKSYLFQALKNEDIKEELKRRAQKTKLDIEFLHLVDKKRNYFIGTSGLETFKSEISEIGDFFNKFWKVYTWRSIIDNLSSIKFTSSISESFSIKNNDTYNMKRLVTFIGNIENIIAIEKELELLDKELNSNQVDIIAIYDNLDLMVEPIKWKNEIAPLINFWQFSTYKRIHGKLFLRSDLYRSSVKGINNVQALANNIISIEWQKEEIFNYFFNLIKRYAKDDFIAAVNKFDFKEVSVDTLEWISEFEKKFANQKQTQFEEAILRKLCWVFFGQYPDRKAFGESYDWLYKNVMNADETISVRPFLDLLSLSIEYCKTDYYKDSSAILPGKYYTAQTVRRDAVSRHFQDLATEKGNESLQHIFDFIDNDENYQYYQLTRDELYELLGKVIKKHNLDESADQLERILEINGILRRFSSADYTFAFLYKYRLGLKNRKKRRA